MSPNAIYLLSIGEELEILRSSDETVFVCLCVCQVNIRSKLLCVGNIIIVPVGSNPTQGNEICWILIFLALVTRKSAALSPHPHTTCNIWIWKQVGNGSDLMGAEFFNTRSPGSLCLAYCIPSTACI